MSEKKIISEIKGEVLLLLLLLLFCDYNQPKGEDRNIACPLLSLKLTTVIVGSLTLEFVYIYVCVCVCVCVRACVRA